MMLIEQMNTPAISPIELWSFSYFEGKTSGKWLTTCCRDEFHREFQLWRVLPVDLGLFRQRELRSVCAAAWNLGDGWKDSQHPVSRGWINWGTSTVLAWKMIYKLWVKTISCLYHIVFWIKLGDFPVPKLDLRRVIMCLVLLKTSLSFHSVGGRISWLALPGCPRFWSSILRYTQYI